MKTRFALFGLSVFVCTTSLAQLPELINPLSSLVLLNPSFAGANGYYRFQGSGQSLAFGANLGNVTQEIYLRPARAGIAFSSTFGNRSFHMEKYQRHSITYAQQLKIGELKITPSVQGCYVRSRWDYFWGEWGFNEFMMNREEIDLNAGLLFNYRKFYAGVSAVNIASMPITPPPMQAEPTLFRAHCSYNLIFSDKAMINFMAMYDQVNNNSDHVRICVNAILAKWLMLGSGYSSSDELSFFTGLQSKHTSLQLSYQTTTASTSGRWHGWELALRLSARKVSAQSVLCNMEAF